MTLNNINFNAWASGQIGSKLWACEVLEEHYKNYYLTNSLVLPAKAQERGDRSTHKQRKNFSGGSINCLWILGGWYGQLAFLLKTRNQLPVEKIRSFDLDSQANKVAEHINNYWLWKEWAFKAYTADANQLDYKDMSPWACPPPDLVINTSVEHFKTNKWFEQIPTGTDVLVQSTDFSHPEHHELCTSEQDLIQKLPLQQVYFQGRLFFDYQNKSSYHRFMVFGKK